MRTAAVFLTLEALFGILTAHGERQCNPLARQFVNTRDYVPAMFHAAKLQNPLESAKLSATFLHKKPQKTTRRERPPLGGRFLGHRPGIGQYPPRGGRSRLPERSEGVALG